MQYLFQPDRETASSDRDGGAACRYMAGKD
jgi:hypothetical protein